MGTQQAPSMTRALLQVLLLQPMAQVAKGQKDHLGRACRSTRVELFIPTSMHTLTRTCTIGSSSIHVHQLKTFCNQSFVHNVHQVNTTASLEANAGMMMTNLKAELPGYSTVWLDPQAMTNVLSFAT